MHFVPLEIHTDLVPKQVYDLEKINLVIYPTKKKLPETRIYRPRTITGLIIKGEKEQLTNQFIKNKVIDFIAFSSFIFPSMHSVKWVHGFDFHEVEKTIYPLEDLENYVNGNCELDIDKIHGMYKVHNFYSSCELFPHTNPNEIKFDFANLLNVFYSLEKKDKLRNQISLFSLYNISPQYLSPFYDNSNVEIGYLYTIVDSLIDEIDSDQTITKKCEKCGYEKPGRKNNKRRINDFVSKLDYRTDDAKKVIAILIEHSKIRNDFFHEAKMESNFDIINDIIEKTGSNTIPLQAEINHGGGRFAGQMGIKELVQRILIRKLSDKIL